VTAPTGTWDLQGIVDAAASMLRMSSTDPDIAGRLVPLATAVTELIDQHLVVHPDPLPESVNQAAIQATVDAYRRKDAPFSYTGGWGADGIAVRVDRDWLSSVLYLLQPWRSGFGCG
jgi:hypothetical protein